MPGWQTAVMVGGAGEAGQDGAGGRGDGLRGGGVVLRLMPVIGLPLVSSTVAVSGWALLSPTLMRLPVWPTAVSEMLAGGQVEKKPALEAVVEFETVAVIVEEPG